MQNYLREPVATFRRKQQGEVQPQTSFRPFCGVQAGSRGREEMARWSLAAACECICPFLSPGKPGQGPRVFHPLPLFPRSQ